jgi:hypothetical protein
MHEEVRDRVAAISDAATTTHDVDRRASDVHEVASQRSPDGAPCAEVAEVLSRLLAHRGTPLVSIMNIIGDRRSHRHLHRC